MQLHTVVHCSCLELEGIYPLSQQMVALMAYNNTDNEHTATQAYLVGIVLCICQIFISRAKILLSCYTSAETTDRTSVINDCVRAAALQAMSCVSRPRLTSCFIAPRHCCICCRLWHAARISSCRLHFAKVLLLAP